MVEAGLEGVVEVTVTEAMTAIALGSGDVPLLGTPAVLALMEAAACLAVEGNLDGGETSVGTRVELSHGKPTAVGTTVTATARLVEVEGRTLTFDVRLSDPSGEVAHGRHVRVVVRRDRFLEKVAGGDAQPDG
jgi:fluoroacetyl-CoA thioesterase